VGAPGCTLRRPRRVALFGRYRVRHIRFEERRDPTPNFGRATAAFSVVFCSVVFCSGVLWVHGTLSPCAQRSHGLARCLFASVAALLVVHDRALRRVWAVVAVV
jgi:hypothetical protein